MLEVAKIRQDFPIFRRKINGKPLVYLDNAATTQKPYQVIQALVDFYARHNANIHRGIHTLAEEATSRYEAARESLARFIGAYSAKEIIFVRNSTEGINLVAYSWGRKNLKKGEEIILSSFEHHSNLVPWQILAKEKGVKLKFVRLDGSGCFDFQHFQKLLSKKTKLVSLVHLSNVLGVLVPMRKIAKCAHQFGAKILCDGSQSVPRMPVNVKELGLDFLVFTGHKMLGPTGIGVLWGKAEILEEMSPFLGGGEMIREVYLDHFQPNILPYKFEAGTPHIAGAIGLSAAANYLEKIGLTNIYRHEKELTADALEKLEEVKNLEIYGPLESEKRLGLVAFNLKGIHPHDLAQFLDSQGIAVRSGHHCAMPLHREILKIPASCRASFYIYNDKKDIEKLVLALEKAKKIFYG